MVLDKLGVELAPPQAAGPPQTAPAPGAAAPAATAPSAAAADGAADGAAATSTETIATAEDGRLIFVTAAPSDAEPAAAAPSSSAAPSDEDPLALLKPKKLARKLKQDLARGQEELSRKLSDVHLSRNLSDVKATLSSTLSRIRLPGVGSEATEPIPWQQQPSAAPVTSLAWRPTSGPAGRPPSID